MPRPSGKPGSSTQCRRQDARLRTPAGTSKPPCLLPPLLVRCAGTTFSTLIQRTDAPEMHLGAGGIGAAGARVSTAHAPCRWGRRQAATRFAASPLNIHPQQHEQARHEHQNATRGAGEAQGHRGASGASSGPGRPARACPAQHSSPAGEAGGRQRPLGQEGPPPVRRGGGGACGRPRRYRPEIQHACMPCLTRNPPCAPHRCAATLAMVGNTATTSLAHLVFKSLSPHLGAPPSAALLFQSGPCWPSALCPMSAAAAHTCSSDHASHALAAMPPNCWPQGSACPEG